MQSRKRWLLIWGCFGFVNTIALAALLLGTFLPAYVPFDYLGWAWMPVRSALNALHIPPVHILSEFLLGLTLKAIVDAAIDCGFAAIVWWAYSWFTQEERMPTRTREIQRYVISLLASRVRLVSQMKCTHGDQSRVGTASGRTAFRSPISMRGDLLAVKVLFGVVSRETLL